MGLRELPVRREVFEEIDPAPKLGSILEEIENPGSATDLNTRIMADANEFFKRTFITPNMLSLLEKIVEGFEGGKKKVFALYSFYGGGKTHTLLAIIHAFRNPDVLTDPDVVRGIDTETRAKLEQLAERIKRLKAELVPFAGDSSKFSGTPLSPTSAGNYAYRTVWGYIAHRLGKYYEFKEFDGKIVAPQQDVIGKLLEGEKALFIFDELSDYLKNLTGGEYREYAQTVVNFIEYFVRAVERSKCIAVISLPVDLSGKFDWRYEGDEIIQSLWNTLKGVAEPFEPLRSGDVDIINVLRKRLFEDIPESFREKTVQKFKEKILNYPEYFGSLDYADKVAEYYPFYPEYIDLLQTLIVRTGMQRTRDALVISMKVLKEIILSGEDPDVIMPWHINLLWFERAFLGGLSDYRHVYIRQVENAPSTSYGDLAKYILRAIFLATYHYDSPIPRDDFPDIRAIVRMAYEPATFSKNNWEVTDVENALSVILATPEITHLNEKDGKYWFWRFPTIKEYIVKRAQRIYEDEDPRIYGKIEEFVRESLEGRLGVIAESGRERRRGRGRRTERIHFFEEHFVMKDYGKYPEDNDKLKLIVILRPDLVSEVENVYNYAEEGKPRSYKNTLVVLAPESERPFKELMMTASMLIAAEEILEEIEAHYGEYGQEVVEVQKSIVDRERREQLVKIAGSIPRVYSLVYYYPVSDSNLKDAKVVQPGYDLAENVHMTLLTEGKIVDTMVFEYLVTLIKNELGVDLERDPSMRTVGQILTWFKQNPRFPITTDKVVKKAIAEGVKMFRIGIMRENKVYFKPVHNTIPPTKDVEGVVPSELRDGDGILSRDRAIEEQFRILKESEKEVNYGTHIERIYYVVYPELGGECYTLSQLETMPDWKEIFLSGVIVKRVEKIDYDLLVDVYPSRSVTVKEGETAKFTVRARPVNLDVDGVKIKLIDTDGNEVVSEDEMNEVSTEQGIVYEYEFEIKPKRDSERFRLLVSAYGKQPIDKELTIVVRVKKKEEVVETDVISDAHIGMTLLRIRDIKDIDVLETIKNSIIPTGISGTISGSILATYGGGELELNVKNIDLETGIHAALDIAEYGDERKITRSFLLDLKRVEVTELLVRKLEPLNKKVIFVLGSGEK